MSTTYNTKGTVLGRTTSSRDSSPVAEKFDRSEPGFDEVPKRFLNAQHKQLERCGDPAMDVKPPKGE